jgi:hypothetical protein
MCLVVVPITSKYVMVELLSDHMIGCNPILTLRKALSIILFIPSHLFLHMVYGPWQDPTF